MVEILWNLCVLGGNATILFSLVMLHLDYYIDISSIPQGLCINSSCRSRCRLLLALFFFSLYRVVCWLIWKNERTQHRRAWNIYSKVCMRKVFFFPGSETLICLILHGVYSFLIGKQNSLCLLFSSKTRNKALCCDWEHVSGTHESLSIARRWNWNRNTHALLFKATYILSSVLFVPPHRWWKFSETYCLFLKGNSKQPFLNWKNE